MRVSIALFTALAVTTKATEQVQTPLSDGADQVNQRPNIIVILTDDQDLHLGSLDYMPLLKKHITDEGTFHKRHYCTTAICCPSRVTLWTGRNAHNTNVTDVNPPYGGYPKFVSQGFNANYLPLWLQSAGYSTYYTGKLFNAHSVSNYNSPHPAGWTSSDFLLDPHTYQYLNATFQRNGEVPVSREGEYSTDLIAEKALGLLDEGVEGGKPFFMVVAPIAPHSDVNPNDQHYINGTRQVVMTAPVPAERHKHLFPDAKVPRNAGFNPEKPSTPSWLSTLPPLSEEAIAYNDAFYRARLQALQAVDDFISNLIAKLTSYDILNDTYIIYTSDNGYHISQHRLPPGKECGFEEDINVPFIVRGPGVGKGEVSEGVSAHADLAPTILGLAGVKGEEWGWEGLDGKAIMLGGDVEEKERGEHVSVEFWGKAIAEGEGGFSLDEGRVVVFKANNTYKALRVISKEYNLYYSVWCTNEHELYDLTTDPHQINNLYLSPSSPSTTNTIANHSLPLSSLLSRLDALLMVTKSCAGERCREPWSVIHPSGDVRSLRDALSPRFDAFYASLGDGDRDGGGKVGFSRCELGYVVESEGVQVVRTFEEWLEEVGKGGSVDEVVEEEL